MSRRLLLGTGGGDGVIDVIAGSGETILIWDRLDVDVELEGPNVKRVGTVPAVSKDEQLNPAKQPLYVADFGDGKATARFDGVDNEWNSATSPTVGGTWVEWTCFASNDAGKRIMLSSHGGDPDNGPGHYSLHLRSSQLRIMMHRVVGVRSRKIQDGTGGALFNNSMTLCEVEYRGTHASFLVNVDGVSLAMLDFTFTDDPTGNLTTGTFTGSQGGIGDFAAVDFRERCLVSPAPDPATTLLFRAEIAQRCGVSLP